MEKEKFQELLSKGQMQNSDYIKKLSNEIVYIDDIMKFEIDPSGIEEALIDYAKVRDERLYIRDLSAFKTLWENFHKQYKVDTWSFVPPESYVFKRLFRIIDVENGYSWMYGAGYYDKSLVDNREWVERYTRWKNFYFWSKHNKKRLCYNQDNKKQKE